MFYSEKVGLECLLGFCLVGAKIIGGLVLSGVQSYFLVMNTINMELVFGKDLLQSASGDDSVIDT